MDGYWELFWSTGRPVFYLLYRKETDSAVLARPALGSGGAAGI